MYSSDFSGGHRHNTKTFETFGNITNEGNDDRRRKRKKKKRKKHTSRERHHRRRSSKKKRRRSRSPSSSSNSSTGEETPRQQRSITGAGAAALQSIERRQEPTIPPPKPPEPQKVNVYLGRLEDHDGGVNLDHYKLHGSDPRQSIFLREGDKVSVVAVRNKCRDVFGVTRNTVEMYIAGETDCFSQGKRPLTRLYRDDHLEHALADAAKEGAPPLKIYCVQVVHAQPGVMVAHMPAGGDSAGPARALMGGLATQYIKKEPQKAGAKKGRRPKTDYQKVQTLIAAASKTKYCDHALNEVIRIVNANYKAIECAEDMTGGVIYLECSDERCGYKAANGGVPKRLRGQIGGTVVLL